MRLDVFLKTSRLIKRRSVAQELCDAGSVRVNGREAKPAKEVRRGDSIELSFPSRVIVVEIIDELTEQAKKSSPHELYHVKTEKRLA